MPFPMSREELEAVDVSLGGCLDEMDARAMAPLLPYIYRFDMYDLHARVARLRAVQN
jgi:hypothetical protein